MLSDWQLKMYEYNRPDAGEDVEQDPKCDKCGVEITTGLMAAFCPLGKECEFWNPAVDEFTAEFDEEKRNGCYPRVVYHKQALADSPHRISSTVLSKASSGQYQSH